jgi:5'-nucleotidase
MSFLYTYLSVNTCKHLLIPSPPKDIMNCFPFEDPCVVIQCTGAAIIAALENGVSTYPALEGRFPQVSGIAFAFDPAKPAMSRCSEVEIAGAPVDLEKEYTLCTREYMVRGKDGFTSLLIEEHGGVAKSIVDEENGLLISTILRQYFLSLRVMGRWGIQGGSEMGKHWDGVQKGLHAVHPVKEASKSPATGEKNASQQDDGQNALPSLVGKAQTYSVDADDADKQREALDPSDSEEEVEAGDDPNTSPPESSEAEKKLVLARKVVRKWWRLAGLKGHPALCDGEAGEDFSVPWTKGVAPRVEGRIRCLGGGDLGDASSSSTS